MQNSPPAPSHGHAESEVVEDNTVVTVRVELKPTVDQVYPLDGIAVALECREGSSPRPTASCSKRQEFAPRVQVASELAARSTGSGSRQRAEGPARDLGMNSIACPAARTCSAATTRRAANAVDSRPSGVARSRLLLAGLLTRDVVEIPEVSRATRSAKRAVVLTVTEGRKSSCSTDIARGRRTSGGDTVRHFDDATNATRDL